MMGWTGGIGHCRSLQTEYLLEKAYYAISITAQLGCWRHAIRCAPLEAVRKDIVNDSVVRL